jgi:hypothetical protein
VIANAVDLPGHPGIWRVPASELQPDSDLGHLPVTREVPRLAPTELEEALAAGLACAEQIRKRGLIVAAALHLQGRTCLVGVAAPLPLLSAEIEGLRAHG